MWNEIERDKFEIQKVSFGMNCLSWERFDMLNSSFGIQHQFNSKTQFSFSEYKKAIWETEIRFLNLDQRFPNPKRLKSMPSVYHFGQFLIKQISSAFLLFGLLNRFLPLDLLLFCCNWFSSYLIYIVKARLEVFVYSDFSVDMFTMHKYLYSPLIFLNPLKTI